MTLHVNDKDQQSFRVQSRLSRHDDVVQPFPRADDLNDDMRTACGVVFACKEGKETCQRPVYLWRRQINTHRACRNVELLADPRPAVSLVESMTTNQCTPIHGVGASRPAPLDTFDHTTSGVFCWSAIQVPDERERHKSNR